MKITVLIIALFTSCFSFSQEHAWVFFNSKAEVVNYLANPSLMLSNKAIARRAIQGIAIDYSDVPVTPSHITALQNANGITYKAKSKWLNAAHVIGTITDINALLTLPFVHHIEFADDNLNATSKLVLSSSPKKNAPLHKFELESTQVVLDYGDALNQIQMFNGHKLHELDYTGAGMHIAVIDAGFPTVDTNPGFQRLHDNGQILGGFDFVNNDPNFYTGFWHGTAVLSDIGGYIDGQFIGTAPDASFYLYITEDINSETPVEESYWVAAAEEADRVGVDVINTSLGYISYDNAAHSYDYTTDLNGEDSFISRGAAIAFSKGIIVINSAGNSGNDNSWDGRITMPADVENVLTVGAVNAAGNYASFSSRGPTSDNRIKPDVAVQGAAAYTINTVGNVVAFNGTSFSAPILAGGVACLWQALPNLTNAEIVQFVKESASIHHAPTNFLGHGIPNLELALQQAMNLPSPQLNDFSLYPNPMLTTIQLKFPQGIHEARVEIHTILGEKISDLSVISSVNTIDLSKLASGVYLARITSKLGSKTIKIIKQ